MPSFSSLTFEALNLSCWRDERFLFNELNVKLSNGQALQITGENGSGKSTLLRMLAGLLSSIDGKVLLNGESIVDDRVAYHALLSYLGHEPGIKLALTVLENCCFMTNATEPEIDTTLTDLGLSDSKYLFCQQLSAGQKRRVALARILLQQRAIWLLDEPLTALDSKMREIWQRQMQQQLEKGGIIMFSTHQVLELKGFDIKVLEL